MLLLLLVIYMFAILGRTLFGANDPHHFGAIPEAMLYLFQVQLLFGNFTSNSLLVTSMCARLS